MNSVARKLHEQAEILREQDKLDEALEVLKEAINAYQEEGDFAGAVKALQSRVLTYKHKFLLTENPSYIDSAFTDAQESLEIAEKHGLTEAISSCYFRLGEIAMLRNDFPDAIAQYRKALDHYAGTMAERGDYRYHLGEALYRSGDRKRGKEALLQGLAEIQQHREDVDPFLIHVWESGAHMRLAELLKDTELELATKHLHEARRIVRSDEKLVIRKRQLQDLEKLFQTSINA